jgi:hypothetical protein
MSDYANALLSAIETGEKETMDAAFNTALNAKIADALEAKKIEVAQSIYGKNPDTVIGDEVELETETSEDNGTEEV